MTPRHITAQHRNHNATILSECAFSATHTDPHSHQINVQKHTHIIASASHKTDATTGRRAHSQHTINVPVTAVSHTYKHVDERHGRFVVCGRIDAMCDCRQRRRLQQQLHQSIWFQDRHKRSNLLDRHQHQHSHCHVDVYDGCGTRRPRHVHDKRPTESRR